MRNLEIRADGCVIRGGNRHSSGLIVKPGGFQGWLGLPAGRREALARAVSHGEHDVPVYLSSRVVTIDGYVVADDEYHFGHLIERLNAIGGTGSRFRLSVDMHEENRWADVRRVSCTVDDPGYQGGALVAEFQLQMVAADPRKYGATSVFPKSGASTVVYVSHMGTFPAFPVVEIPDAPSGYSFVPPGPGRFTVAGATAGGTHLVNLRTGRVFRNGVEMPGVGSGDLWAVPPGEEWQHTLSVPGFVRIDDTYI